MDTAMSLRRSAFLLLIVAAGCHRDATPVAPLELANQAVSFASSNVSEWSAPVSLGPVVNSPNDDQTPALSPDGLSLYFLSTRPGAVGGSDLWVSRRSGEDDAWGPPQNLGPIVNSPSGDAAPFISRDGHQLYFTSNRAGGLGDFDILVARRSHTDDDFAWEAPVNVGPPISSVEFDGGMTIHGPEFYFSRGLNTTVSHDMYISQMSGDTFGAPSIVPELSSTSDERRPSIRFDGREIFFHSNRPGGVGLNDLWTSKRQGNGAVWSTPVNLGPVANSASIDVTPSLSYDGMLLVFASNRPGGSGALDLYYMTRTIGGQK